MSLLGRRAVWLFVALNLLYHSNMRPMSSGDSFGASLIPISVVLDGTVALDRFGPWLDQHPEFAGLSTTVRDGHRYSSYPAATGVLVSPLYLPLALSSARSLPPETLITLARILEKIVATGLAALSGVLMLLLLERITTSSMAWSLAWVYALATPVWSISSQALWQHGPGQICLLLALLAVAHGISIKHCVWAGCAAGVAAAIRPSNLLLTVALCIALVVARASLRAIAALLLPVITLVGMTALYNLHVAGTVWGFYSVGTLDGSFLQGLLGLLISPGRGLLWFCPVLLLVVAPPQDKQRTVWLAAAIFAALHLILIAKWRYWWGGYSWGPRLLSEAIPAAFVLIAMRPRLSRTFWATAVYSIGIQMLGVYFYPKGHWDNVPVSVDVASERLWDWRDNPIRRTASGGFVWEGYAALGALAKGGIPAASARLHDLGLNAY